MNKVLPLLILLCSCASKKDTTRQATKSQPIAAETRPAKNYNLCKADIAALRKKYAPQWVTMPLTDKQKLFTHAIAEKILPQWLGTAWNFYGTTETPGNGSIACGYFVTTTLRDGGVALQRAKLAQCASEQMIQTLVQPKYIQRFSNVPMDKFIAAIKQQGYGLYITGLDSHTGFIYNDGTDIYFIHANYMGQQVVQKEKALTSVVLAASHYKITGKISADERVLDKWISR